MCRWPLHNGSLAICGLPEAAKRQIPGGAGGRAPRITHRTARSRKLAFPEFKELYLGVLRIDREVPGTGIVDRFIADVTDESYMPLFPITPAHANRIASVLLLLGERRIKSFPGILRLLERMIVLAKNPAIAKTIERHVNKLLTDLARDQDANRYVMSWVLYFLKSNKLQVRTRRTFNDPILRSIQSDRIKVFTSMSDLRLFRGVRMARRAGLLLRHLDAFNRE